MLMTILMQESSSEPGMGGAIAMLVVALAITIATIAALWQLFVKAGRPGWHSLIPVYDVIVWLNLVGRPWWYVLALVTPVTAVILWAILGFGTARSFNRGILFSLGVTFMPFIFLPILGFGNSQYIGGMGPSYRHGPKLSQQA